MIHGNNTLARFIAGLSPLEEYHKEWKYSGKILIDNAINTNQHFLPARCFSHTASECSEKVNSTKLDGVGWGMLKVDGY